MNKYKSKNRVVALKGILVLAVMGLASGCALRSGVPPVTGERAPVVTEIVLLHDNDLHFDFNHRDAFESAIAEIRESYEHVFLLNAGDIFVRHAARWPVNDLDFYAERTRFMIETMNDVGYDVMTLGNHELDIKGTITRDSLRLANFPILAANLEVNTDDFDRPDPYTVLETSDGHTIAVLGLTGGGIGSTDALRITDRHQAFEKYRYLADKHDVFVVLTHIGYHSDIAMAWTYDEIDVIIGGHSHTLVDAPGIINNTLVTQAGGHSHALNPDRPKMLGIVILRLEDGVLVDKSGRVIKIEPGAAALSADVCMKRLDKVIVWVNNHLAQNDVPFEMELMIDGETVGISSGTARAGEPSAVTFGLQASLTATHSIEVTVRYEKPDDLPNWQQNMDFRPLTIRKDFAVDQIQKVQRLDTPFEIDGDMAQWRHISPLMIGDLSDVHPASARDSRQPDEFIDAAIYTAWNADAFYLAVAVSDDRHFNEQNGSSLWDGDSLQFAVASRGTEAATFNLGLALASGKVQSHQWRGPETDLFEKSNYTVRRNDENQTSVYQIRIPFECLKINPVPGTLLGFNAVVFDDDDGKGQEYWIQLSPGIAGGWRPADFRRFVLMNRVHDIP